MPEARPASVAGTSAIASVISGRNDIPAPMPSSMNGSEHVREVGRVLVQPREPDQRERDRRQAGDEHPRRADAPHQPRRDAERHRAHHSVIGRNARPGLERAVAAHPLEVERAEHEGGEHPGDQERAHDARAISPRTRRIRGGKIGVAQARLEHGERASSARPSAAEAERVRRAPAVLRGLDDRVDDEPGRGGHRAPRRASRRRRCSPAAGDSSIRIRPSTKASAPIGRLMKKIQCQPIASVRLAAREQPDRAAAGDDERVDAHRDRALARLAELGDDQREDHGRRDRAAEALHEARGDQHRLVLREPAGRGRRREEHEPRQEDALAADEVAEPAGQEQEGAEGDHVRVQDPGQVRLGEVEVGLDGRERDVHDRRVEDHHQLSEAHHDQRRPAPPLVSHKPLHADNH